MSPSIVRGNHDRALQPDIGFDSRTSIPRRRLPRIWTRGALHAGESRYLERLPRGPLPYDGTCDLVHGSPADEDEYLISASDAAPLLRIPGNAAHLFRPYASCRAVSG